MQISPLTLSSLVRLPTKESNWVKKCALFTCPESKSFSSHESLYIPTAWAAKTESKLLRPISFFFFWRPINFLLFIYFKPWFLWFLLCIYFCIPQSSWLLQIVCDICMFALFHFWLLVLGICASLVLIQTIGLVLKIDYHLSSTRLQVATINFDSVYKCDKLILIFTLETHFIVRADPGHFSW